MPISPQDQQRLASLQQYPLTGSAIGQFVFTSAPAPFLQSLLPPDLELAPQTYTPAGYHPLLLMYNDTVLNANPFLQKIAAMEDLGFTLKYHEFIVMLPYVQFTDPAYNGKAPYCYLPVLYLDSVLAVLGGRVFWEFNKELATFDTHPPDYIITQQGTSTPLVSGESMLTGFERLDSSIPNFNSIVPILQLPVIEHGPIGYVSSIYQVDFENIDISPGGIVVNNLSSPFLPFGLINSPAITENVLGAFHMNYNWALSYIEFIKF